MPFRVVRMVRDRPRFYEMRKAFFTAPRKPAAERFFPSTHRQAKNVSCTGSEVHRMGQPAVKAGRRERCSLRHYQ